MGSQLLQRPRGGLGPKQIPGVGDTGARQRAEILRGFVVTPQVDSPGISGKPHPIEPRLSDQQFMFVIEPDQPVVRGSDQGGSVG